MTKMNKSAAGLIVASAVLLVCGYFAVTGLVPKQVLYSTDGTTTEYGAFGATVFSKYDPARDPDLANEVLGLFEDAGFTPFLHGSNPSEEWTAYRIDYGTSERLGLTIETTEPELVVVDHYRAVIGDESRRLTTSNGASYDWDFGKGGHMMLMVSPSSKSSGSVEIKVTIFRDHPLKTLGELKPDLR